MYLKFLLYKMFKPALCFVLGHKAAKSFAVADYLHDRTSLSRMRFCIRCGNAERLEAGKWVRVKDDLGM